MERDRNHPTAVEVWRGHGRRPLVVTAAILGETWTLLRRRDGHRGDALSFEVMRRRALREALAFDGDFAAAGFAEGGCHEFRGTWVAAR